MTLSLRRAVALFGVAISAAAGARLSAQSAATPAPDVHAVYEPPSGPGIGQEFLKTFEGEWTVERRFYPPSGGAPTRATGECVQKMVQDGRFLESRFAFHQDGRTTTGVGVSGFDPRTGLFTTFWYDSRSTRMSIRRSREPFDGKQIVLYSVSLGAPAGQPPFESRTVSRLEDGGRRLVHQQFNKRPDGQEKLLMELILTRKS